MIATRPSLRDVEAAVGSPKREWAHRCHEVSLAVVKSDLFPAARVARGYCSGVGGQHSWVVVADGPLACYRDDAPILDPTLWSYDRRVRGLWWGTLADGRHAPHGRGSIWSYGRPAEPTGEVIALVGAERLSSEARDFLRMAAPGGLDVRGWGVLAHAPVLGWPSGEIIAAMYRTPKLRTLVPIDIVGMATDLNPGGMYLKGESK